MASVRTRTPNTDASKGTPSSGRILVASLVLCLSYDSESDVIDQLEIVTIKQSHASNAVT